jgi:hypothetical protein
VDEEFEFGSSLILTVIVGLVIFEFLAHRYPWLTKWVDKLAGRPEYVWRGRLAYVAVFLMILVSGMVGLAIIVPVVKVLYRLFAT